MGGMHSALRLAQLKADVVCAFDINQHANLVYEKNYNVNVKQTSLERITPKQLDAYNAQMWLMAPPCQPYTRQGSFQIDGQGYLTFCINAFLYSLGKQLDQDDPRAAAILNLVKIWPELRNKPQYVLIENVVNFESSQTRDLLVEMFRQVGYTFQEFHLSPTQFGIPNSRMRYYCLAKLRPANFYMQEANGNLMKFIPKSSFFQEENHYPTSEPACLTQFLDKTLSASDLESLMIPEQKVLQAGQTLGSLWNSRLSWCQA
jgi:tRNA (cytosine38-C5)-methyltransferase